jgi:hypothetical protein
MTASPGVSLVKINGPWKSPAQPPAWRSEATPHWYCNNRLFRIPSRAVPDCATAKNNGRDDLEAMRGYIVILPGLSSARFGGTPHPAAVAQLAPNSYFRAF